MNKVLIVGRMTADPQLRTTAGGQSVTTFGVATNRTWTNKAGAKQENAEFHNVVAWGRQAEIASQFLTKGAMVMVEGRLQTRTWQDKQNQSHRVTEIICERLQLGPRPAGGAAPKTQMPEKSQEPPPEDIPIINLEEEIKPEDLPF